MLKHPQSEDEKSTSLLIDNRTNEEHDSFPQDDQSYDDNLESAVDDECVELLDVCGRLEKENEESWEDVRAWLRSHSLEKKFDASMMVEEDNVSPLHMICLKSPPMDVVMDILDCAPESVQLLNDKGWLPLHCACYYNASYDVIRLLTEKFPEGSITQDLEGRTPLHYALIRENSTASVDVVSTLLTFANCCHIEDLNGFIPLHFACVYAAQESVILLLIKGRHDTIVKKDKTEQHRTPLHYLMSNGDHARAHTILEILMKKKPSVVNIVDSKQLLPIESLGVRAKGLDLENVEGRKNILRCLSIYLNGALESKTELFHALQSLPDWMKDEAIVRPEVQQMLNKSASERLHTAILLMDFWIYLMINVFYITNLRVYIKFLTDDSKASVNWMCLPLYVGSIYFVLRELIQIFSMLRHNKFHEWWTDLDNIFDVLFFLLVVTWAYIMNRELFKHKDLENVQDLENVRMLAALTAFIFHLKFLFFFRSIFMSFAVFIEGFIQVTKKLGMFMVVLLIILIGFMQAFYTLFNGTKYCDGESDADINQFCNLWPAFLKLSTMLLGGVDDDVFRRDKTAVFLFILFMVVCVILLANVLIAIVTQSYAVIRDERAEIIFWTNRLDVVAEMKFIKQLFKKWEVNTDRLDTNNISENLWNVLTDKPFDEGKKNIQSIVHFIIKIFSFIFVSFWVVLGFFPPFFGLIWPPQVRSYMFEQKMTKSVIKNVALEQSLEQTHVMETELEKWQKLARAERLTERKKISDMNTQLSVMKKEMSNELKDIKRVVQLLFEVQVGS